MPFYYQSIAKKLFSQYTNKVYLYFDVFLLGGSVCEFYYGLNIFAIY